MRKFTALIALVLAVALMGAFSPQAAADPSAEVQITLRAPEGVPATAILTGPATGVVGKPASGTVENATLSLPAGEYAVEAPPVVWLGQRFVAGVDATHTVSPDGGALSVEWVLAEGLQDFFVTALGDTSATFSWAANGDDVTLVRDRGEVAPATPSAGVQIPVGAAGAVDEGLQPGTTYSYSAFVGDDLRFSVRLGTADPGADIDAAHVVAYGAVILPATAGWTPLGDDAGGIRIAWPTTLPLPLRGAGIVVPVSEGLPGGFVGVVTDLAVDGSTVDVTPGGVADVLAYLALEIEDVDLGDDDVEEIPVTESPAPEPERPEPPSITPAPTAAPSPRPSAPATTPVPTVVPTTPGAPQATRDPRPRPGLPKTGTDYSKYCQAVDGSGEVSLELRPSMAVDGHFRLQIDRHRVFGTPTGATVSHSFSLTSELALDAEVEGKVACSAGLKKLSKNFAIGPVPFTFVFEPTAEINFSGAVKVDNLGVRQSVRIGGSGSIGFGGASYIPDVGTSSEALTPTGSVSARVGLEISGKLTFGPGQVTDKVGAVAGIAGELKLVDLGAEVATRKDGKPGLCLDISAQASLSAMLTARAFAGPLNAEAEWTIWEGALAIPGSPWVQPKGCNLPPVGQDLLGPGVEPVDDEATGLPVQWGRVDGFVPGEQSWVLSTGDIADAVGDPGDFASTDLGRPGDPRLDELAGHPTYDAVTYTVNLVPTGNTLKVRYVFATEEFPEFVGQEFNDVMAIYVGGQNCALVPGTEDPVSVNTVNLDRNAEYFVDNRAGAAGYGTSMNGLTVPLTCSVPVTPGQQVQVSIALADASDGIYDSAVALLDKGIWSE